MTTLSYNLKVAFGLEILLEEVSLIFSLFGPCLSEKARHPPSRQISSDITSNTEHIAVSLFRSTTL